MFDATYVINLDRSPERWEHAQRMTTLAGFPNVMRFRGVDGAGLGARSIATLQGDGVLSADLSRFDAKCRAGEIGCGVSHANVLREIVARGWTSALVLEDDIELEGDPLTWRARFETAYRDLPASWELWYLHRCFDIEHRITRVSPRTVIPWTPLCGTAYAVTAAGARVLLDALTPVGNAVDRVYMDVVKARAVSAFAASPMLLVPAALPSLINAENPAKAWVDEGINRPPEYWPERYLAHLGDEPLRVRLARWWRGGWTLIGRILGSRRNVA